MDTEYYKPEPFAENLSFLLIARLLKDKGIREYAESATIIKQKYPKISFRLVGWIEDNPASISKKELDLWVKQGIIDYLSKFSDVRPAIAESSVYVLPSYLEGTPRTVLEAMAMGRPIITTDAPGCRETVQHGKNGFLVPVKNVPALLNAMEKFIIQPELTEQMGKASRQTAAEKYDVHKVNALILKTMGLTEYESGNEKFDSEEIFEEIITLIHCFSMRHYSRRRLNKIRQVFENEEDSKDKDKESDAGAV